MKRFVSRKLIQAFVLCRRISGNPSIASLEDRFRKITKWSGVVIQLRNCRTHSERRESEAESGYLRVICGFIASPTGSSKNQLKRSFELQSFKVSRVLACREIVRSPSEIAESNWKSQRLTYRVFVGEPAHWKPTACKAGYGQRTAACRQPELCPRLQEALHLKT